MAFDFIKRAVFCNSVVEFLHKFGFDGLELNLEYPPERDSINGGINKVDYGYLISDLDLYLHNNGLELMVTLSRDVNVAAAAYDIPKIAEQPDYFTVSAHDFHQFDADNNKRWVLPNLSVLITVNFAG